MIGLPWLAALAALGLLAGLVLLMAGRELRLWRGLGSGKTISLDRMTLTSRRYGLTGRPDRLIRQGGKIIPEEWKSAHSLRPWHRVQMGVYFLLIEDQLKQVPPYGFLVCGDGSRHRIDNDETLRVLVLELTGQIRAARAAVTRPISVRPHRGQCRPCGMRAHCRQASI